MESFQQCRKSRQKKSVASRVSPLRHMLGTLAQRARGIVGRTFVNPPAQKRMNGKYMLDVFGGVGAMAKTDLLGLRGYVFDTKFGSRYDVQEPVVLIRTRQDAYAGNLLWE